MHITLGCSALPCKAPAAVPCGASKTVDTVVVDAVWYSTAVLCPHHYTLATAIGANDAGEFSQRSYHHLVPEAFETCSMIEQE